MFLFDAVLEVIQFELNSIKPTVGLDICAHIYYDLEFL